LPRYRLSGDFLDQQRSKRLPMPVLYPVSLTASLLEDQNLAGLVLLDDAGHNLCAVKYRLADFDLFPVGDEENIGQLDGIANVAGKLLNPNLLAGCDLILFPAGTNDCVHKSSNNFTLLKNKRLLTADSMNPYPPKA